jgi:hypothetical protein
LEKALQRWSKGAAIKTIAMSRWELEMLIGKFSKFIAKGLAGPDAAATIELCDRLEHAARYNRILWMGS